MISRRAKGVRRITGLSRNIVSLLGAALVFASGLSIAFLFIIEATGEHDNPYLGIFTYIVLPGVLGFGLAVILAGMLLEWRRRRRLDPDQIPAFPVLDLNDPRRRRAVVSLLACTFVFVLLSAFGSYRAYEYTESVGFCGELCHSVMQPEFVAFQASPHARLRCVDCHVGPGATWYVRSKLSGAYQLYAVIAENYPKPIPTPVHNLRPAQDTCEQCHWPAKFYGAQLKVFNHFGYDEQNTLRQTRLLIKTGGGSPTTGQVAGIHWHMNIANEITYASTDEQRQVIPWVRMVDKQGNATEYRLSGDPTSAAEIAASPKRRMDCVDCHNRPSHVYVPPDRAVDEAILAGKIDVSLPYIKREAVAALSRPYGSTPEALESIGASLDAFYRGYPDVYAGKHDAIEGAVVELRRIYQTYFFPEMKVDWQTHPNNAGHYYSQGCFRCHDGKHVSDTGKVIRNDCAICHTVLDQTDGAVTTPTPDGTFRHPADLGGLDGRECSVCHKGDRPFRHPLDLGDLSQFKCSECHGGAGR